MSIFRSRTRTAREIPAETEGPYRTRYDIAREGYEMRARQLARALDQASLKNYLAGGANIVLAIGLVTIALRGGVKPIFIPYDELGRVIHYEDLARFEEPPRAMVEAELARWLSNVRGIYYGDAVAQLERGRAAKRLLRPEAEQWLSQYFSAPERNPALLLRDVSRTVEVASISRDPDRNLWYLQWREIEVPARGSYTESAWQATLKVDFQPAVSEEEVWANPTGLRISAIEWNRIRTRAPGASATPSPRSAPPDTNPEPPAGR